MALSAQEIKAQLRAKRFSTPKTDLTAQPRAPAPAHALPTPEPIQHRREPPRARRAPDTSVAAPQVELATIAALYQYPKQTFPIFTERGRPDFFSNPVYRSLLESMSAYLDAHGHIDPTSFLQHLLDSGQLKRLGGPGLIGELLGVVSPPEAFTYHLDILRDKYVARQTTKLSQEVAKKVSNAAEDELWEVISEHERAIADLRSLESPDRKSALSIRRFSELIQMTFDDLDNFFGDRILAAGQPCTLLGPGGIGKSRLSLQLSVCMITGREFLSMPTHASNKRWLFIQTENSNRRLHYDLKNIVAALDLDESELKSLEKCLVIHTLESELDSLLNLSDPSIYGAVKGLIDDINPDFVQWDPLNSLTDADLNSDMDMRALVSAISSVTHNGRQDRVPLVLHHSLTGRAGAARAVGWDKSSYGRNSKVLQAWTRAQINLAPRSPDDPNLLLLSCGKNNNGRMFPEIGVIFNDQTGIYITDGDFDPGEFRDEIGLERTKKKIEPFEVAFEVQDGIPGSRLRDRIMQKFSVGRATAYRAIETTKNKGLIREETKGFNRIYFRGDKPKSIE